MVIDSTLRAYQSPTRMAHGLGSLSALGEEARGIGITRPLVVTDAGIVSAGLLDEAAGRLRASDLEPVVYAEVRANPGVELVDAGARLYRSEGCDGLIAIGGGSSMAQHGDRPRVGLSLEQAVHELQLKGPDQRRCGFQAQVCLEPVGKDVPVLPPPAMGVCLLGE